MSLTPELLKGQLYPNIFLLHQKKQSWRRCPLHPVYMDITPTYLTESLGQGEQFSRTMSYIVQVQGPVPAINKQCFQFPRKIFQMGYLVGWFFSCMTLWFSSVKIKWDDLCFPSSMAINYLVSSRNKLVGPVTISRYSHIIFWRI